MHHKKDVLVATALKLLNMVGKAEDKSIVV